MEVDLEHGLMTTPVAKELARYIEHKLDKLFA